MALAATKADVEDALEFYKHCMGLDPWRISLTYTVSDPEAYAHITCSYEYMKADLAINLEMLDCPDRLNRTIVHELAHCLLSPVCDVIQHYVTEDAPRKTLLCQQELVATTIEQFPIWEHIIPPKRKTRKK